MEARLATVRVPDGRALAYRELGDDGGYPVVWCHGGLSSALDAENARAGATAARVRLIAPDRPGIGTSDRQKHRSVGQWGTDVAALAEQLGLDEYAVVGWSAGGPHALACAAADPQRVTAVATIGGMAPVRDHADRKELGLRLDRLLIPLCRWAPWVAAMAFRASKRQRPEKAKAELLGELSDADRRVLDPLPASRVDDPFKHAMAGGPHGLVDDYRAVGAHEWDFRTDAVTAPVTIWQGEADAAVPVSVGRRLAGLFGVQPRLVPDAGHFLVLEHGEEIFTDLIRGAAG